jgi:hypothetical protein
MIQGSDGVVWALRNFTQGDGIPDSYLFDFFYQPMSELYAWLQDLFAEWPNIYGGVDPFSQGMAVTSWYRNPGRQRIAEQQAGQGHTISSHLIGLAFDIHHPDGLPAYLTMGAHADNYWGGPTILSTDNQGNVVGADPQGAAVAGRVDGYWTSDYSERDLHFHIQRFTGRTSDWQAWITAIAQDSPQYLGLA